VAEIGEAGAGDEPHIAGADHSDTHASSWRSGSRGSLPAVSAIASAATAV
jgi:hypothetical protein